MKLVVFLLQLPETLRRLEDARCSNRMHCPDQPSRQVGRALSAVVGIPGFDIVLFLAVGPEPDVPVGLQVN